MKNILIMNSGYKDIEDSPKHSVKPSKIVNTKSYPRNF